VGGVAILTFGGEAPLINVLTARNVPVFAVDADQNRFRLITSMESARLYSTWRPWEPPHRFYRRTTTVENCHHAQIRRRKMPEGN
jgi:hypothetical protein